MMNMIRAAKKMFLMLAVPFVFAFFASAAQSGDFYEKDGVAIRGYDPVAYFLEGKAVAGSPDFVSQYKGSTFRFSSKANLDSFTASPAKYAPQYNGYCAFGTAGGYKAAIAPDAFTIVDDKLYLNYSLDVRKEWSADIPGFISKADKNWPKVSTLTKIYE